MKLYVYIQTDGTGNRSVCHRF